MKTERGEKCNCAGITRFVLAILCKKQVGSLSKMLIKSQKKSHIYQLELQEFMKVM